MQNLPSNNLYYCEHLVLTQDTSAEVTDYYIGEFHAELFEYGYLPHPYRIIVPEDAMRTIMEVYDYEDNGKEI